MSRCNCANPPGGFIECPDNCIPVCFVVDGKAQALCYPKTSKKLNGRELAKRILNEVAKKTGKNIRATEGAYSHAAKKGIYDDKASGIKIRFNVTTASMASRPRVHAASYARTLSKSEVAATLAEKVGLTKKQSIQYLESLADLAYKNAKNTFTLPGIGKLRLKQRAARVGRNPSTGNVIAIPAKTVVKFQVAKAAKDAILGKK